MTNYWLTLVCISLLSGCGHLVQLENLKHVVKDADISEVRKASSRGVLNGAPRNANEYIVGLADIVEFSSKDGTITPMPCDNQSEECKKCPYKVDAIPPNVYLAQPGKHVRVSVLALEHIRGLRLGGKDEVACMGKVRGASWGYLKEKLEKLNVSVKLLPQESQWAMPGDIIKVMAEYRFGLRAGSAPEPYTFAVTTTQIDSGGRGYVPAFDKVRSESKPDQVQKSAANEVATGTYTEAVGQVPEANSGAVANDKAGTATTPNSPLEVVAVQQAEEAARRISFWLPGEALDQQPTLDELERCLKAVLAVTRVNSLNKLFSRCASLGIDEYRYTLNPANNRELTYHFSVEHNVTFVLWNGQRFVKPYRAGQTVAEAAKDVHREVFGHVETDSYILYATVDPHPAIRFSGERPFYARLVDLPNAILDRVLLLPGDVVHLSRWEPRLPQ